MQLMVIIINQLPPLDVPTYFCPPRKADDHEEPQHQWHSGPSLESED